jgi:hypothetical protein
MGQRDYSRAAQLPPLTGLRGVAAYSVIGHPAMLHPACAQSLFCHRSRQCSIYECFSTPRFLVPGAVSSRYHACAGKSVGIVSTLQRAR